MGDKNQVLLLKHLLPQVDGPILETGSMSRTKSPPYRTLYPHHEFLGVDMAAGKNVDVVQDLTHGIGKLRENYYDLVICTSVLEHVADPLSFSENISQLVKPGGFLYLSVPWIWRYHKYPDDYFRYSTGAFSALYPDFKWETFYASTKQQLAVYEIIDFSKFETELGFLSMMINSLGVKGA